MFTELMKESDRLRQTVGREIQPFAISLLTQLQVFAWRLESGESQDAVMKDYYELMTKLRDSLLSP